MKFVFICLCEKKNIKKVKRGCRESQKPMLQEADIQNSQDILYESILDVQKISLEHVALPQNKCGIIENHFWIPLKQAIP